MGILDSLKKLLAPSARDERTDLEKKLRATPNDPQLRQKYAMILLRKGEIAGGLSELAKAGELYEKGGFATKGIAVIRQILKFEPANLDARRRLIGLLALEGLSGDAQHELEKTAELADLFASADQKVEFLHSVAEVLRRSPLPFLLASDCYRSQRKFLETVTELGKAAPLVGEFHGMRQAFSERARALSAMAGDDPEHLELCGFVWLRAGLGDEGLALLDRVLESARGSADASRVEEMERVLAAIREAGGSAMGAASFSDAARKIAEARSAGIRAEIEPGAGGPRPEGAESADDAQMVRHAVSKLQQKVSEEIGDSDHEARYNLGIAYKEMGLLDEAAEEFRISRGSPALFLGASSLLAETLAERGDLDGAVACLDEVLERKETGGDKAREIRYRKGILLSNAGRAEEAGAVFAAILEEAPDYRDVRDQVARLRS